MGWCTTGDNLELTGLGW